MTDKVRQAVTEAGGRFLALHQSDGHSFEIYLLNGGTVIRHIYLDNNGEEWYVQATPENSIQATIDALLDG